MDSKNTKNYEEGEIDGNQSVEAEIEGFERELINSIIDEIFPKSSQDSSILLISNSDDEGKTEDQSESELIDLELSYSEIEKLLKEFEEDSTSSTPCDKLSQCNKSSSPEHESNEFTTTLNSEKQELCKIPRSVSSYRLEEEQNKHSSSDEEFHNSYSRKRPLDVDDYIVVAAATIHLGDSYSEKFYNSFLTLFADYIDEEEMTYETVEEHIEYLRSNPQFYKDIEDEAYMFLFFDSNVIEKSKRIKV